MPEQASDWTCRARAQGTAGGNDPSDCDWPFCGCDPHATKVMTAIEEAVEQEVPAEVAILTKQVASLTSQLADARALTTKTTQHEIRPGPGAPLLGTLTGEASFCFEGEGGRTVAVRVLCHGTAPTMNELRAAARHMATTAGLAEAPLPTWDDCHRAVMSGTCTRLEKFIYDNEPGGDQDAAWRASLAALVADPNGAIDT